MSLDVGCWITASSEFRAQQELWDLAVLPRYCLRSIRVSQLLLSAELSRQSVSLWFSSEAKYHCGAVSCSCERQEHLNPPPFWKWFSTKYLSTMHTTVCFSQHGHQLCCQLCPLLHLSSVAKQRYKWIWNWFQVTFLRDWCLSFPSSSSGLCLNSLICFCCWTQSFESALKSKAVFPKPGDWHVWDNGKSKQSSLGKRFYLGFDFFSVSNKKGCNNFT